MPSHLDMLNIRIIGFSLKIDYIGSVKLGCYYLQHVSASKPFDHTWLEIIEAKIVYCT
jgi:hypothetical protein